MLAQQDAETGTSEETSTPVEDQQTIVYAKNDRHMAGCLVGIEGFFFDI
jgi:hypothetical protein